MRPVIRVAREVWADPSVPLPSYETDEAAGADVRANLPEDSRESGLSLAPGARLLVPTGLRVEIPAGYEIQLRARSGLALRHGIGLANGIGTVDADYRGPVGVILVNQGEAPFTVAHGDRIAQMVVAPVIRATFESAEALTDTGRAEGGFGSTGRT